MPSPDVRLRPLDRTPLAESLSRLESLVSPLTGLVAGTGEIMHAADDARLVKVGAQLADHVPLVGTPLDNRPGGAASDYGAALAAAVGEAAERYSASYVPVDRIVAGRASELEGAVDPARFALFAEEQYALQGFPFRPFTDATRIGWIDGYSLPDGAPALLPAQLVLMPFDVPERLGEPRIGYTTSNGLACRPTREEAVLAGLLELVERDAFMITWENRLSHPRLEWGSAYDLVAWERRYFAPSGLEYAAVDLSEFWDVPTVMGVVRAEGAVGALGVGAAAATTVADAWRGALAEAFAVRAWARSELLASPGRVFADDYSDVTSFADHVVFHGDPRNRAAAAFLDASQVGRPVSCVSPLPTSTPLDAIRAICRRLALRGVRAYAVDVTTVDVAQAGLHVVKVVAPELCALSAAHGARFLGGRRLRRAAYDLGLVPRPLALADLNPHPHPFP
jgi:ribosomal protein S12 methylthiotransferase accessory factor